jgi:glutaredoxin 3
MADVLMYCTGSCPFCHAAERLLSRKGVTGLRKIRTDLEAGRREEMTRLSGRRTVPQIWIGERHVGGCDDLYELERTGELDALLRTQEPQPSKEI